MQRSIIPLVLLILFAGPLAAETTVPQEDRYIQELDAIWADAYNQIYNGGLNIQLIEKFKYMLKLCDQALAEDPDNYEYLWRYALAAAQYASTAQSIQEGIDWKSICREWGLRGFEVANKACEICPERPEAFFWRNYSIGMYVLIGGIEPIINAVKEGFLFKSQESVFKGYDADKSYQDYIPVFACNQFLAHIPTIPFIVKGSKKDRYQRALNYHKEHMQCAEDLIRQKKAFEWDVRCFFIAEFLLDAVDVLDMKGCAKQKYTEEARGWCQLGIQGPRPYYVNLCQAMLDDSKNWQ